MASASLFTTPASAHSSTERSGSPVKPRQPSAFSLPIDSPPETPQDLSQLHSLNDYEDIDSASTLADVNMSGLTYSNVKDQNIRRPRPLNLKPLPETPNFTQFHRHSSTSRLPSHTDRTPRHKKRRQMEESIENDETPVHSKHLTFWSYLLLELKSHPGEVFTEEKTEHLINFINVPLHLEKVMIFGTLACLDSFLHFFTILPLRFIYAIYSLIFKNGRLPMSRKADIIKGFIIMSVVMGLNEINISKTYHLIRGGSAIKLYVMYNVLEVADKLLSALGQDILECLFSHKTLSKNNQGVYYFKPFFFALLTIAYVFGHSLVILYQIISLNVAVNSYSNALLTLLLSNQFSEIKSAVFKKFERENLFQMTCADITERFQMTTMLFVIGMRNIVEVSNAGIVPRSWSGWNRWLGALFGPMIVVVGSEICVDWLKHAYISKFNNIRARVYHKFLDILTYDYSENALSDYIMTKRVGLPILPIASVFFRMLLQSYSMLRDNQSPNLFTFKQSTPTTTVTAISPNMTTDPNFLLKLTFPYGIFNSVLESGSNTFHQVKSVSIDADTFFSYLWLSLVALTVFILLFVMKLTLGLFLLQYSCHRRNRYQHLRTPTSHSNTQFQNRSVPLGISYSEPSQKQRDMNVPPRGAKVSKSPVKGDDDDPEDFVPGLLKGGQGVVEIPEHLRIQLYDPDEKIPPAVKPPKVKVKDFRDLLSVHRFKMTAKQIW